MILILVACAAFLGLCIRYLVISGGAYWFFWQINSTRFAQRRIQSKNPLRKQLQNEVFWSLSTFLIFSVGAALLYRLMISGHTHIYFSIADRGWVYFTFSIVLLILLHDTYFYIAHRFMHLKWVFRHVHRIHHLSTNPSPWAAFSFHPLEAVIEGAFIYAATLAIPIHWLALAIFIVFSHAMNVMGHLGYEMFPRNWNRKLPWALWNSSTHHNMHHQYFHSNYGLYFNLWDLIFRTNHPRYHDTFEQLHEAKVDAAVQA